MPDDFSGLGVTVRNIGFGGLKVNSGSLLLNPQFLTSDAISGLTKRLNDQTLTWKPVHEIGAYSSPGWAAVHLMAKNERLPDFEKFPELKAVVDFLKCNVVMMVFYKTVPGHRIHPHRDLSGTLEVGRLRFHIPIITHPNCKFFVSKKHVPMKVGELWALNTSYLHAVENLSDVHRVHLVIQVEVNDWVRQMLPKHTLRYHLHAAFFFFLVFKKGVTTALANPRGFSKRIPQGLFFVKRILGLKPKS